MPFALLYLNTPDGKQAKFAGAAGVERGSSICPATIELDASSDQQHSWPLRETLGATVIPVENLADRFGVDVPRGPWSEPPRQP